jgi:hypothetical protein
LAVKVLEAAPAGPGRSTALVSAAPCQKCPLGTVPQRQVMLLQYFTAGARGGALVDALLCRWFGLAVSAADWR